MQRFKSLFKSKCSAIGMIHVDALPGTPIYKGSIQSIVDGACKQAEIYLRNKIDGLLIENMFDVPYIQPNCMTPETVAVLTRVCSEITRLSHRIPCGVQVLAGGNKEALAVAQASGFQFIRVEGFVFSHIADEGFTDASAGKLLRYRKQIGADDVSVFCDIKKKHSSHAITSDVSLEETARAAEFFLADGLIITGTSTGAPANVDDLKRVKSISSLPVIVGSGVTLDNLEAYTKADALIVGSYFKDNGIWSGELSESRVASFLEKLHKITSK